MNEELNEKRKVKRKVYYWYDHLIIRGRKGLKVSGFRVTIEDIKKCILEHDWEMFCFYQTLLNRIYHSNKHEKKLLFLPKISKKDFMLITDTEYECG